MLAAIAPLIVIAPEPPIEVLVAAIVTAPLAVAADPELIKAPLLLKPVPVKFSALAILNPLRSSV